MDDCAPLYEYASHAEHREGAEVWLRSEQEAGWLELFQSDDEAKAKYGEIV